MNRLSNDFVKPPSDRYHDLFKKLDYLVVNNEHCLIIGDRGTGKSSALKYIYEKTRHPKPLEVFDVDTENSNLMDFKDGIAESSLMRKFKSIKGGLLCIKELSQLDIQMQNDLLSMLTRQSKGEDFTRLIVISEKQKQELKQLLIPKLYNVLECASVVLPTLKGKDEDILFFASHFIQFANHTLGKNVESIHPLLQEEILRYDWSGNIQELKNCMIKAVLISEGKELGADLISALFKHEDSPEIENDVIKDINSFRKENYEKEKIKQALELSKGNKTMAASILNIDRKTLYNKIKLYNVSLQ